MRDQNWDFANFSYLVWYSLIFQSLHHHHYPLLSTKEPFSDLYRIPSSEGYSKPLISLNSSTLHRHLHLLKRGNHVGSKIYITLFFLIVLQVATTIKLWNFNSISEPLSILSPWTWILATGEACPAGKDWGTDLRIGTISIHQSRWRWRRTQICWARITNPSPPRTTPRISH